MNKRTLFIVGGIAVVLVLCACVAVVGVFVYGASRTAQTITTELETVATVEVVISTPEAEPTAVAPEQAEALSAEEAANIFLRYLGNQQYEDAVAASSSELREDPATPDLLREIVEEKGLQPGSWEFTGSEVNDQKQETYLDGVMTYADGSAGVVEVQLRKEGGRWMVFYLDLKMDGSDAAEETSEEPGLNEQDLAKVSADVFTEFWKNGEYGPAFAMGSSAFQEQVGSPEKLEEVLGGTGLKIESWAWEEVETFTMKDTDQPVIQWKGTAHFQNDLKGPLVVQLVEEEAGWLVLFFDVKTE